tara:strand:- start:1469 stop:1876 length:408 start_codon:yes stop_codon:yes gene_type:complete
MNSIVKQNKTLTQSRTDREAKAKAASAKLAGLSAPMSHDGMALDTTITLIADVPNRSARPKQAQLILNYLEALGGTATVEEVHELSLIATGANLWTRTSNTPYVQDVPEALNHYKNFLRGTQAWGKRKAKQAYIR